MTSVNMRCLDARSARAPHERSVLSREGGAGGCGGTGFGACDGMLECRERCCETVSIGGCCCGRLEDRAWLASMVDQVRDWFTRDPRARRTRASCEDDCMLVAEMGKKRLSKEATVGSEKTEEEFRIRRDSGAGLSKAVGRLKRQRGEE